MLKKHNLLNDILDTRTKIKILRLLTVTSKEVKYSGREVAGFLNISPTSACDLLNDFFQQKIVWMEIAGRSKLYYYNKENMIVREILLPLFRKEKQIADSAKKYIVSSLSAETVSIVLFGSTVRDEDTIQSDFDVFFLVRNKGLKIKVENKLDDLTHDFWVKFGRPLSPYLLTLTEFKKRFKEKLSVLMDIINQGELLSGKSLRSILTKNKRN